LREMPTERGTDLEGGTVRGALGWSTRAALSAISRASRSASPRPRLRDHSSRRSFLLAPLALFVVAAAGWGAVSAAGAQKPSSKPVLGVGLPTPPIISNDPGRGQRIGPIDQLAYEPIIVQRVNGSYGPGLAVSWHYFNTRKAPFKDFEFTLRHDARFSD